SENPRIVEIHIELGNLHRDWLQFLDPQKRPTEWYIHYHQALAHLNEAVKGAEKLGLQLPKIDAFVNMAWTHFYAREWDKVEQAITFIVTELNPPLKKSEEQLPSHLDREPFEYYQLSKLFHVQG